MSYADEVDAKLEEEQERRRQAFEDVLAKKMTQTELARQFGVTRQAASQWMIRYKKDGTVSGGGQRGRTPTRYTPGQLAEAKELLKVKGPHHFGIPTRTGTWGPKEINALMRIKLGHAFATDTCLRMFASMHDELYQPSPEEVAELEKNAPVETETIQAPIPQEARSLTAKELAYYEEKVAEAKKQLAEKGMEYDPEYGVRKKRKGLPVTQTKKKKKSSKNGKKGKKKKKK